MTKLTDTKPATFPRQTPEEFKTQVRTWASRIGVEPRRVQVQRMSRKWASCSPNGTVTFSIDLLDEDSSFADAVIVHELVHLTVLNHGRLFRSLVQAFLPGADALLNGRLSCAFTEASS